MVIVALPLLIEYKQNKQKKVRKNTEKAKKLVKH